MTRKQIYEFLAGAINQLYPDLLIVRGSINDVSYPDVQSVKRFAVIQQSRTRNLHIPQGRVFIPPAEEGQPHGVTTFQNREVEIQFDFYGETEDDAIDRAMGANQWLQDWFLRGTAENGITLKRLSSDVINNSDLFYGKRYLHRFTFKCVLFVVDSVTAPCSCAKLPENLIIEGEYPLC